jgi:hypothetical protein
VAGFREPDNGCAKLPRRPVFRGKVRHDRVPCFLARRVPCISPRSRLARHERFTVQCLRQAGSRQGCHCRAPRCPALPPWGGWRGFVGTTTVVPSSHGDSSSGGKSGMTESSMFLGTACPLHSGINHKNGGVNTLNHIIGCLV